MTVLLGLDLETTGLDPQTDAVIEFGYALVQVDESGSHRLIQASSVLIKPPGDIPEEITALTGISSPMLSPISYTTDAMLKVLRSHSVHYFVAHNADFERGFLSALGFEFPNWIDTRYDLPYPPGKGSGSLSDICMGHGVFNPMPHRALTDTLAMMQLMAKYPFAEVERLANAASLTLEVIFPYDATGQKQAAVKALGYHWDGLNKRWLKKIKDLHLDAAVAEAEAKGFKPIILNAPT